jgi:3-oxoacyl-[acyl-carrier protein] reductase
MEIPMKPLVSKHALVLGGSRGIGAAIVRRLAADGATVAFTYTNGRAHADALVAELVTRDAKVVAIQADSADPDAIRAAVTTAVSTFGGLDVLVNNAGIIAVGPIETFELALFDRMHAINVRAVFVAAQAAIPHLPRGGRIITIGSITSGPQGRAGSTIYGTTKAAVARMVRGLALDLAPRGISVVNVEPGPTETDMTPGAGPVADWIIERHPLGRLGKPDEISNLVGFLAGPEATYINGASLTIDGGFTA